MKLLLTILLFINADDVSISEVNGLKRKAEEAYLSGNYQKSAETYSYLVDTLNVQDDRAIMNLANSYFKTEDTESALSTYQRLQETKDKHLKSQAYQQMGILSKDPKTLEKALAYFKESIKSDPTNNDARYNYEMVKKKLTEQEKNQENQQDQDKQDKDQEQDQEQQENKDSQNDEKSDNQEENQEQQNKDQEQQNEENKENQEQQNQENKENQEQQNQENQEGEEKEQEQEGQEEQKDGEEGEEEKPQPQPGEEEEGKEEEQTPQQSTSEKLQEMNLSEEKARMILEALKNSEIQYIQQNRRKPTKRKDSNKPDW
ncbi:MAG: hypothetical protein JXQ96_12660 [Cyclobacteriaceae bacterium]